MLKVNLTKILCQRTLHLESNKNFLWKNTFQRIIETSFLVSKESKNDSFHHRRLLRDQLKKLTRVSLLEAQKDNFWRYSFLGFTHISYCFKRMFKDWEICSCASISFSKVVQSTYKSMPSVVWNLELSLIMVAWSRSSRWSLQTTCWSFCW